MAQSGVSLLSWNFSLEGEGPTKGPSRGLPISNLNSVTTEYEAGLPQILSRLWVNKRMRLVKHSLTGLPTINVFLFHQRMHYIFVWKYIKIYMGTHLHRIGIRPDPSCMLCSLHETMDRNHLGRCTALSSGTECERYWEARTKMMEY